jgi:hypothetical protein
MTLRSPIFFLVTAAGLLAAPASKVLWQEKFDQGSVDWVDPLKHSPAAVASVFTVMHEGPLAYLHARHDRTASKEPPALHYGKVFSQPVPLDKIRSLGWRWRALKHPAVGKDPWIDLAASVYVLIRRPGLLHGGRGFKFGWTAVPAKADHQHGLLETSLRAEPASREWKRETVDLCALYREEYKAPCAGETVEYIGVVTDADNTHSIAEGDYADFSLEVAP